MDQNLGSFRVNFPIKTFKDNCDNCEGNSRGKDVESSREILQLEHDGPLYFSVSMSQFWVDGARILGL